MDQNTTNIAQYVPTEAALTELESRYKGIVFDFSRKSALLEAKEANKELRTLRIDVESMRQTLKAPILEKGRLLDEKARQITGRIVALEKNISSQVEAEEQRREELKQAQEAAKKERLERIQAKIEKIRAMPLRAFDLPSLLVENILNEATAINIDDDYENLKSLAELVREDVISSLERLLVSKRRDEQEAERLKAANHELESRVATLQSTVVSPNPVAAFNPFAPIGGHVTFAIGGHAPLAKGIPPIGHVNRDDAQNRLAPLGAQAVSSGKDVGMMSDMADCFANTTEQPPSPAPASIPNQVDSIKNEIIASLDNLTIENLQRTSEFIKSLTSASHFRLAA